MPYAMHISTGTEFSKRRNKLIDVVSGYPFLLRDHSLIEGTCALNELLASSAVLPSVRSVMIEDILHLSCRKIPINVTRMTQRPI